MERPVNNSEKIAAAFCNALDAGTRVAGSVAVATGAVAGYEIVRHYADLGIEPPISIVDAQGNCNVLLKSASVGVRTPDGQIRAIAGRNFTLAAAGRTYPTESDSTGRLIARSTSGATTGSFDFKGNSNDGKLSIRATDTEAQDPSKSVKELKVDCNIKTDLTIVYEAPPSNATPGNANIAKPNGELVSKPQESAPAKPVIPATSAPAKPAAPVGNVLNPGVLRPGIEAPANESTPWRGWLIPWSGLDGLRRHVDENGTKMLVVGGAMLLVGWIGSGRGVRWYDRSFRRTP
jgi:hypothetical protein